MVYIIIKNLDLKKNTKRFFERKKVGFNDV